MLTDIRLFSHQLAQPQFEHPRDLVAWMGAVQAQDYRMAKWAVGVRLKGANCRLVDDALAKGEIVRMHIMRPTWHFVAGKDLRWMLALSGQRVKKAVDSWVKGGGYDISEEVYAKCNDFLGKILSGHRCLTRLEIEKEFERAGIATADDRVRRYVLRAEVEGLVCSGGDKDGEPTYALLDEQVAPGAELHREEALAQLAIHYFRSHSPAGIKDFTWWSGLSLTEAKQAIALADRELRPEKFGGQEFWVHESCRPIVKDESLHYLPPFDEYLISYKERQTVIEPEYYPKAFNRWGIFYPVILHKGRIIGNWSKVVKRGKTQISTSFFDPGYKVSSRLLEQAESRYKAFMEIGGE